MASAPSSAASSLEWRLAALESTLGLPSAPTLGRSDSDVLVRIDRLLSGRGMISASAEASAPHIPSAVADDLDACDRLARDLDPGSILTHQTAAASSSSSSAAAAPLLYRRQEVLASRDWLGDDLKRLGQIRDLLLASSPGAANAVGGSGGYTAGGKKSTVTAGRRQVGSDGGEEQRRRFVDAPLVSSEGYCYVSDADARRRLDAVSVRVADLQARASDTVSRADDLLARYCGVMAAVSEKLVMADEEIGESGR